ncbi:MAG: tryptophan 7-halogenase, partial [Acidobacteriota bacterium]|nr:tryptophan 7-halogenase [Acidobacteriota bacterium]
DAVADSHWLRADVDRFLVDRALAEGIEYRDRCTVQSVDETDNGLRLRGTWEGRRFEITAAFAVDASGPAGVVAKAMGSETIDRPARFRSGVVFGHFEGVRPLAEIWRDQGAIAEAGPYPDEAAAVHHLLDDGWVYVLPFDHDCVSAGLVLDRRSDSVDLEGAWEGALARHPTLALQFEGARRLLPLESIDQLQFRRSRAVGARWAALPNVYAFFDPMFSTGIAWSLLGVERLAALLSTTDAPDPQSLRKYELLLEAEADQMERLLYGAHLARRDFSLYAAHSQLYFALVSYEEVRQRIFDEDPGEPTWHPLLGAGDEWAEGLLSEAVFRLAESRSTGDGDVARVAEYEGWVAESIAPRNIAGLADTERRNLYPVDLELLVRRAELLGLTGNEMRRLLPRLRGRHR